jgi:hypothetical protein
MKAVELEILRPEAHGAGSMPGPSVFHRINALLRCWGTQRSILLTLDRLDTSNIPENPAKHLRLEGLVGNGWTLPSDPLTLGPLSVLPHQHDCMAGGSYRYQFMSFLFIQWTLTISSQKLLVHPRCLVVEPSHFNNFWAQRLETASTSTYISWYIYII